MGKRLNDLNRTARQLDVATEALDQIARYRFDPNKPAAEMVRMKMKIRKALDDIRKRPGLWPWKFRPCGGHGHNPMLPAVVSFSKPKADGTRTRNCKRRSAWYRGPIRSDGRGSDPIPGTPIIPRSHSYRPQVPAQGIRAGSQVAGYARG